MRTAGLVFLVALLFAAPASARVSDAQRERVLADVSGRVMCPSCDTTLDNSNSPAAEDMRAYVVARINEGRSADEIVDMLVEEYGDESILAVPRADSARGALAWGVPVVVGLLVIVALAVRLRRARRRPSAA